MIQIRKGVFETNSSSTHSICISKWPAAWPKKIVFTLGEYGWPFDHVCDTASYLYTGICDLYEDGTEYLERLKAILEKNGVEYEFENPEDSGWWYLDHGCELVPLIEELLNNEDMLCRFLCGDSCVYTGNDNSGDESCMCWAAEEVVWDEGREEYVPNPNHNEDRYEYFFKGN